MAEPFRWDYDGFCRFYELLTLPDGKRARLEGHLRLILREIFERPGDSSLLVMLPKGNGKTALMAALAVYHLLVTPNANCFIGAADKGQAKEMYRFATHFIRAGSGYELEKFARVLGGTLEIRSRRDEGFVLIVASDDSKQGGKKQGLNATLFLLDELHAHENENLYVDGRSGLFKRDGIMVNITTAGWDQESVLGKLRAGFLKADQTGGSIERGLSVDDAGAVFENPDGRLTLARLGDNVMLEWACLREDQPEDFAAVKLANPASWVTVKSIKNAYEEPGITPWTYARYRMNRWTTAYESWLPMGSWEALTEPGVALLEGVPTYAALDMARYRDAAALVLVQVRDDGRKVTEALIERPGGPDDPVRYETVKEWIRAACERYDLRALGYDPKYFDQAADELAGEGIPLEAFPQSNERMCPAWADLRREILERKFVHDGDDLLTSHMYAGTIREVGTDMFKVEKAKGNGPDMDAAEALAMANALANQPKAKPWGLVL